MKSQQSKEIHSVTLVNDCCDVSQNFRQAFDQFPPSAAQRFVRAQFFFFFFFFCGLDVDDLQAASLYEKASEARYLHTHLFVVFGLALTISADLFNLDIHSAKPVDSIGAPSCSSKKFVLDWIGLDD
jgi:hypothetical protein